MYLVSLSSYLLQGSNPPGGFGGDALINYLLMIGLIFLVFYFLVFRPERKRKANLQMMINELKAGDKIITIGGIHGTVAGVTDKTIVLRISEQVKIEISRQAVGTVVKPEAESGEIEKK